MSANKDQKRQRDNPQDKTSAEKKKSFQDFKQNTQKPFQQFSNPNKFGGGGKSFNAFHRRLGK